jgi:RND family efflux transporter MFP subunit
VTRKLADNGDTVTAGQTVAMVSQTDKLKIQFYIEAEQLTNIVPGMAVQVVTSDNQTYDGVIASVSQQPDPASHRFLAELTLANNQTGLVIGTVVNVKVTVSATVAPNSGLILLPLSALSIGENATTVFIDDNGIAKKSPVEVGAVVGEYAKVKTTLAPDAWIIIDGNKMLQEGQAVTATTTPLVQ